MEVNLIQIMGKEYSYRWYAYKVTAMIIMLYFVGGIISSICQLAFVNEDYYKIYNIYSQGVLQIFLLLVPTIYFAKRALLPFSVLMRQKTKVSLLQITAGVIGIVAFQLFVTGFIVLQEKILPDSFLVFYKEIESVVEKMYLSILGGTGYLDLTRALFIGALIPAIAEETLFRGFVQSSLEQDYKPFKAILITSIIFSLLHINPIGFIPLVCIGLYLGFVAYITKNLILPMLIHFVNNAFAIIIIYSPQLTELENNASDISWINASIMLLLGLTMVFLSCYLIYMNNLIKESKDF